ncbi:MAG: hypothetical protein O3C60_06250 [Planctomycetota bacterium]|nr:hypothetical protein [Planctomycetota bacterium]
MGRRWIAALAAAFVTTIIIAKSEADSKWHLPKPRLWPSKEKSDPRTTFSQKSTRIKSKEGVEPASAWETFTAKPAQAARTVTKAPVDLAKRAGTGTKQFFGQTRELVTAPFQGDDTPKRKSTKSKNKGSSKSLLSNPFASKSSTKKKSSGSKKKTSSKEQQTVTEFLQQDRPGFDD